MPGDVYPKFRAAAVQAAPVFLDRDATIDRLETFGPESRERRCRTGPVRRVLQSHLPVWNLIYTPWTSTVSFDASSRTPFKFRVNTPGD